MFYLHRSQLKFLKSIPKDETMTIDNISDSKEKIISFLEDQKLIDVSRKILRTQINSESHTYRHIYGEIESVSLSEQGKAYLSERKHERFCFWIPIIIDALLSIAAIVISIISLASCPY